MKNEKGITLTTLVLYITVLLVVVAIVGTISSKFYDNMKKIKTNATNLDEYNRFISFFIEDIKREKNSIISINDTKTEIVFTTGNTYTFDAEKNQIRFNELVLVNNVTDCTFSDNDQEEKTIVTVNIIINGQEYSTQYSTKISNNYNAYIVEDEYVEKIEFAIPEKAFATKWAVTAGETITLPIYYKSGYDYNFTVDYGDGTGKFEITSYNDEDRNHTYAETGTYTVVVLGICNGWSFSQVPTSCTKITEISQWYDISFKEFSLNNCTNLFGSITNIQFLQIENLGEIRRMSSLKKIDLGANICSISQYSFFDGTSPEILICRAQTPPILESLNNGLSTTKILVHLNSINIYKSTTNWVDYAINIGGFTNFEFGDLLTQVIGYITIWYPTQDDMINGTNGIIADGINTSTIDGEWYCTILN